MSSYITATARTYTWAMKNLCFDTQTSANRHNIQYTEPSKTFNLNRLYIRLNKMGIRPFYTIIGTHLQDTQLRIRDGIKIIGVIGNCHWFC